MTTPLKKTVEVTSSQADKFATINLQERQSEAVSVRVIEVRTSAPPALGTDGATYIVGSGSISAGWAAASLNQIAADLAGVWYFFTPIEGWMVWNNATDKVLIFNGSAWVNASELSLGVSTFTNGSIPFITTGTFTQDNANLSYDDALNILKALRVAWSVTTLAATTTLGATHGRNINVSGTVTLTLPAAATSAGVEYLISKTDSSATTVTIDANAAELINGAATTTLSAQYSTAYLICNGTGWNLFSSGGTAISITDNVASAFSVAEGSNNYFNIITTNSSEKIEYGNATTNPVHSFLGNKALILNNPNAANITGSPQIIVSALAGTGVGRSDVVVEIPDTINNTGGMRIANASGGSIAGFSAQIVATGVYPAAIGRGYFWAQNGASTTTCGGWEADGAFYVGAVGGLYGKLTVAGTIAAGVSSSITSATTLVSRTGSRFNECSDAGGSFTITLPTAASATGVEYTFRKTNSSTNTITIDGSGAETIDSFASLLLYSQRDILTIYSNGTEWIVREYTASGTWTPRLYGSTTAGSHTYTAIRNGTFTRNRHLVTLNFDLELSAKDAAMAGQARIDGFPFTAAASSVGVANAGKLVIAAYVDFSAGFTEHTVNVVPGQAYMGFGQLGDNTFGLNTNAPAIFSNTRVGGTVTYPAL